MQRMRPLVVVAALLTALAVPTQATAASPPIEPADVQASRAFMTEFGVAPEVQDRLLNKGLAGGLNDADVRGAKPVSVTNEARGGSAVTISTYADGSIGVVERELPRVVKPGGATTFSVTGCRVVGGSGWASYTNCKVHYRTTIFSYGFYANFTTTTSWDSISSVGSPFFTYAVGHNYESHQLRILKGVESASEPAHAELAIIYNVAAGIGGQVTKGVRLKVGGNQYWQENS
ncbi:hypothetical protein Cch01nite_38030 [Cellulomonas chitinilytica]|uniref:Uncharacterized protein n=2 Tax=Cellulomonas chitinilytica TaxID=398759 RepID=A0A919U4F1_9CELL|nr:hypothetical protein Cch01nite_38030 [Cellulomonas chitinilytica]